MPKPTSIHSSVSIELRLVTDRHRHRAIAGTALAWRRAGKTEKTKTHMIKLVGLLKIALIGIHCNNSNI